MQEARDCAQRLATRYGTPFLIHFETWAGMLEKREEWYVYSAAINLSTVAPTLAEAEAKIIEAIEKRQPIPDVYAVDNKECPF